MKKIISWVALVLVFVCFISFSTLEIKDVDVISVQAKESDELKAPKYIFMFIVDGMSQVQVNAAQIYKGTTMSEVTELSLLSFTKFPVTGLLTTQNAETFVPDSASTATALSSGIKTNSGVLGLTADKTKVTESDGQTHRTKEPAIMFFYRKRWFNIIAQLKKYGLFYYCNIATPYLLDGKIILTTPSPLCPIPLL